MSRTHEHNYSFLFNCLVALTAAAIALSILAAIAALETLATIGLVTSTVLFFSLFAFMGGKTTSIHMNSYYPPMYQNEFGLFGHHPGYTTTVVTTPLHTHTATINTHHRPRVETFHDHIHHHPTTRCYPC